MKLFLAVVCLAAVAFAAPKYEPIVTDYHNVIGIPEAARIKAAEAAIDFDGARIAGGSVSSLGDHPHMGGLLITLTSGLQSLCGSSLISETRIATAAHCWRTRQSQARHFTVVLGSLSLFTGGTRIDTNNVELHDGYNMDTFINDVAIAIISRVSLNNHIRPISLASGNNQYVGFTALAAGYGRTGDSLVGAIVAGLALRHVNLEVISTSDCQAVFGSTTVIDSTICVSGANGRSTCAGDSGGPLTIDNNQLLVGITSFGAAAGCERNFPAGFARVTSFKSWFDARM